MPRLLEAKKDVTSCEKPRRGANTRYQPWISEWGNPARATVSPHRVRGKPAELKHLSRRRKRKQK